LLPEAKLQSTRASIARFATFAAVATLLAAPAARSQSPVPGAVPTLGMTVNAAATPAAGQVLHLVFGLNNIKRAERDAFLKSQYDPKSPNFRKWLTPEEYGTRFGASPEDVQAVVAYAQSKGFRVTNVWPNRSFVSVDATAAQAEAAFGVKLQGFNRPLHMIHSGGSKTFYAPNTAPTIAAGVASKIGFVAGLTNLLQLEPKHRKVSKIDALLAPAFSQSPATNWAGPVSPSDLSKVYNIDALHAQGADGQNQTIAIFSPTLRYPADVTTFAAYYNITGYTISDVIIDDGPTDYKGSGEAALDAEIIIGQAPHANVKFYSGPNDTSLAIDDFNKIATDNPPVVSASWALGEDIVVTYNAQWYSTSFDDVTAQMATQGQSWFNASGDWGAYDASTGAVTTVVEASGPNVIGVGGTSLPDSNNGAWNSEIAWYYSGGLGGGGGLSVLRDKPSWQTGPGVSNTYSTGKRQVPDIAALGFAPYYDIYADSSWGGYYGTSASTPLWASVVLLYNQLSGQRFGNLNPALYALGTNDPSAFHDIVDDGTGRTNGIHPATAGWDYITGWGSANFGLLYTKLVAPASPTITSFTPTSGLVGTVVTIAGTNLTGATSVTFNGTTATTFSVDNSAQITATVPTGATTGVIGVTTPGGTATSTDQFTVTAPAVPTITSFTPSSGSTGTVVTITGTNLSGATAVKFNTKAATSFTVNSATSVTATLPTGATTGPIAITTAGGTATSSTNFTVTAAAAPAITSFTPASGQIGALVTINGTNFTGATAVKFNNVVAPSFTVVSAIKITATVPAGATTGLVKITTPGGTATSASNFTVTPSAPAITSFSPATAKVGALVTVNGTNFTGATTVKFHGLAAAFTIVNATKITATVPAGATSGTITVTTPVGTATSANSFTVAPSAPTITILSPSSAKIGTLVTIAGTGFTGATTVRFYNNVVATFTVVSATKLTATVPTGTATGPVTVITPAGVGVSPGNFTITVAPPTITNFSPTSGKVGDVVTVAGTTFTGLTSVKLNGVAASFTVVNASKFTFKVPAGATTGKITATTPAGTATHGSSFTVKP